MKLRKPLRYLRNLILFFFISTIATVIIYRFLPVYVTPLMVIRSTQQLFSGKKPICRHIWVPFDKLSPNLPMAVIASEDNRFVSHNGFDMIEIKRFGSSVALYQTPPETNPPANEFSPEVSAGRKKEKRCVKNRYLKTEHRVTETQSPSY